MNRFAIGFILLFCAQSTLCTPIIVKRGTKVEGRELMPGLINVQRLQMANQREIANMYEMKYNDDLEKIALKLTCEKARVPGPNYMVAVLYDQLTQSRIAAGTPAEQQNAAMESGAVAFGMPGQYKFACADFDKPCPIQGTSSTIVGACLIGPESSLMLSSMKFGPPGSQCPIGKTASGLCLAP